MKLPKEVRWLLRKIFTHDTNIQPLVKDSDSIRWCWGSRIPLSLWAVTSTMRVKCCFALFLFS
jgi:hypothetical protein